MSGNVVPFPHHARASSKPKRAGSARAFNLSRARSTIKNLSAGIAPRFFQLLTAETPTPAMEAVADGPPNFSTTASMVESMTINSSRTVNVSSVHRTPIVTDCEVGPNGDMPRSPEEVAARLRLIEIALERRAADICRDTGIGPNAWSQYKNSDKKRPITRAAAYKLKDAYGITLEYIFDGDRSRLPADFLKKLRRAAASLSIVHNM